MKVAENVRILLIRNRSTKFVILQAKNLQILCFEFKISFIEME